jgi:hypothetical protein
MHGFKTCFFFVQKADDFLGEFHELLWVLFFGGKGAKFHPLLAIFHKDLVLKQPWGEPPPIRNRPTVSRRPNPGIWRGFWVYHGRVVLHCSLPDTDMKKGLIVGRKYENPETRKARQPEYPTSAAHFSEDMKALRDSLKPFADGVYVNQLGETRGWTSRGPSQSNLDEVSVLWRFLRILHA